jgi:D-serine deaminase-like pyridoxal phosphate-dependent protein
MDRHWVPARAGDALADVDPPALIVDLDKFDANIGRLMQAVACRDVRVRPHAKSHKCVEIARRQVAAGAVGICVQKTSEAEPFLAGGIEDVLVTNEVVGGRKLARLAALAARFPAARLGVCVDDKAVALQLAQACDAAEARIDVYVELDVGHNRAGLADPVAVVALARAVDAQASLTLRGLHAYFGSAQHRRSLAERRLAITAASALAQTTRDAMLAAGLPCGIVTGGGTGTFMLEAASGIYNEIQPGSYVLMDVDYAKNDQDPNWPAFEQSLFILTTVMSRRRGPNGDRATLDAGLKSFSTDSGSAMPAFGGWQVRGVSDEHTVLERIGDGPELALGDKPLLVPGHVDPTVNLHEWIVAVRNERVEAVWTVDARGTVY